MSEAVIYRIVHVASGRCYIGHTTQWSRREKEHSKLLGAGKHHSPFLQRVWTKHGADAFVFEVLETCEEGDKLAREQWWIDNSDSCFNFAKVAGSRKGVPQSPEAIEKVRQAHLGKKWSEERRTILSRASMGKPGTRNGKKHTAEAIAKMKASWPAAKRTGMLGRKHRAETIEQIKASNKANTTRAYVGMKGQSHSDDAKRKMRLAQLGRKQSPEQIAKRKASLAAYWASRSPEWRAEYGRKVSASKAQPLSPTSE